MCRFNVNFGFIRSSDPVVLFLAYISIYIISIFEYQTEIDEYGVFFMVPKILTSKLDWFVHLTV